MYHWSCLGVRVFLFTESEDINRRSLPEFQIFDIAEVDATLDTKQRNLPQRNASFRHFGSGDWQSLLLSYFAVS
jgi:hypothetical protein